MTNIAAITTNWRDIGDTQLSVIEAVLKQRKSPMLDAARATHEAAKPHSALFWAQAGFENQFQTTGIILKPSDHNPVAMRPEKRDDPGPYGSGVITASDGGQFLRFRSDADAAKEWKRRITSPTYKGTGPYMKTTTLESYLQVYAPGDDKHPVTGVLNADAEYLETVTRLLRQFAAAETPAPAPIPPKESPPMVTMKAVNFVGAKRTAYLPSWIPVEIKIINSERFRSYTPFTQQTKSTYHDTGNPRTNADDEYSWAAAGRPGGVVGGYGGIFDHRKIIQTGPFNEESWHAGTPAGNRSFGFEHAFGGAVEWLTSLEVGMALHGAVLEMQDLNPDDDAVLHQFWTGKWCAAQILNRGIWNSIVKPGIKRYWQLARAARNGQQPSVPTPGRPIVFATPDLPTYPDGRPWDGLADLVVGSVKFEAQRIKAKTTVNLRRRQYGNRQAPDTGEVIPADTEVELLGWVQGELVDGVSEWWVGSSGSRLWGGGIDAEPKTDPEWGQHPEVAPGVQNVNGRLYYPLVHEETGELGREITVHREGNLRKWADTGTEPTGEVKPGEVHVFKYWTRGESIPLTLKDGSTAEQMIWYAKDLHSGDRMWSGLSEERPD